MKEWLLRGRRTGGGRGRTPAHTRVRPKTSPTPRSAQFCFVFVFYFFSMLRREPRRRRLTKRSISTVRDIASRRESSLHWTPTHKQSRAFCAVSTHNGHFYIYVARGTEKYLLFLKPLRHHYFLQSPSTKIGQELRHLYL